MFNTFDMFNCEKQFENEEACFGFEPQQYIHYVDRLSTR